VPAANVHTNSYILACLQMMPVVAMLNAVEYGWRGKYGIDIAMNEWIHVMYPQVDDSLVEHCRSCMYMSHDHDLYPENF
jgi:hypothetical protein